MKKCIAIFLLIGMFQFTGCSAKESVMLAEMGEKTTEHLEASTITTEENKVYVYVCGHVKHPGVYPLDAEARICDALELAGGVTKDGKPEALNQAEYVKDGQTIYVPGVEDDVELSGDDGLVNINEADKEMLMTLPGIGELKADIIIQYREEHGEFESVEDLMNIPGIKEGVFNKIKDGIKVS